MKQRRNSPAETRSCKSEIARRMDLTTLRLFVAICDEGNLTRASQREAIAPSAVSKRLHDLEEVLDVALFERQSTGMALTPAGQSLLHHARIALLNVEKIAVDMAEHAGGIRGHVRMLANLSSIVEFLPEDLPGFFRSNGMVRLDLQERPSAEVVRGVEEGVAEIGICSADVSTRGLTRFSYRRDRLVIVVQSDHPLVNAKEVSFADTLDYDHVGLFATSSIYLRSQYTAQQIGKSMRLRVHVPGFDAVCRMVQAGMGVGLIPDRAFEVLSNGMNLAALDLKDDWADRELVLVARDPAGLSATSQLMLDHLRKLSASS
ncbi:LysR family transcriptional regulator [Bradyrhizobium sacchari]|uniref:DNA-binding transcriptional LysR family regulator n=1 Tax=Bradyrhizobium sacchari TaxID=1399419 RepID=A0A560JTS1_9BRAD|nr:LysR family transcriptional regulator [Bradyrhizobium sacchari]OPY97059.1 LysR family transcriptional regulator [Bradyrhizobium sacchari]TWB58746.1 DNA-binding transcriptional LysR family regulator [Bradyrhizobium sacchari]TWB72894.1 DNA-binding transcriptional LysR family regulator [Bradyrhizobium sacchari]